MPCILPRCYYKHAAIGWAALAALRIDREQMTAGLTRTAFLAAQMDTAATLDIATLAATKNTARPRKAWRRTFTHMPGFCWVKLIADKWVVPAMCMLGAYPAAANVVKLASRFRTLESGSLSVYKSHRRKGEDVLPVMGTAKPTRHQPEDRLWDLRGVDGSRYPPGPSRGPLPPPGPPRDTDRHPPLTHPSRRAQVPPAPRQGVSSGSQNCGPRQAASPSPYAPYPAQKPAPKRPDYTPQVWQKANQDDFDVAVDAL